MREPLRDKARLEHMLKAIDIILQRTSSMTFEELSSDKLQICAIILYTDIIKLIALLFGQLSKTI